MNKAQLVEELTARFEGNKRAASHALESVVDTITRAVAKGEKVAITGFGSFERVERAARFARNPRTGERVRVKKTAVPRFKPGAELKAVVSGAKKLPRVAAATAKSVAGGAAARGAAATRAAKNPAAAPSKAPAAARPAAKATAKRTTATPARPVGTRAASKATASKATASRSTSKAATKSTTKSATSKATTTRTPAKRATRAAKKA